MIKLGIYAVGRLRGGPEAVLIDDFLTRTAKTGRALGVGPAMVTEVEDRKNAGKAAEAALLRAAIPDGAVICALDERGKTLTSPEFAQRIADWRDDGRREAAFVIGGADGLDRAFTGEADLVLSLGKMVWPHMLARVMLAEQLYRATTILAGTPYHRN